MTAPTVADLARIVARSATILGLPVSTEGAEIIAGRWGGSGERLVATEGRIHRDLGPV